MAQNNLGAPVYVTNNAANPISTSVSDGAGGTATALPPGRAAAAASVPVVFSNEDFQTFAPTSTARLVSAAASTNATSVKASQGRVFRITGYNSNAAARYLKMYNKASLPTVGTDTPIWTEYLAAQTKFSIDVNGLNFSTGIAYALTTAGADSDTGALTAGDVTNLNIAYS